MCSVVIILIKYQSTTHVIYSSGTVATSFAALNRIDFSKLANDERKGDVSKLFFYQTCFKE